MVLALKLTDIVYTSGPPSEGGADDRSRTGSERCTPAGDPAPCPGGHRQRLQDLPSLRDRPARYYTWLRRYEELGLEGLRDRSRRPHVSPNAADAEVVGKIVYSSRQSMKR